MKKQKAVVMGLIAGLLILTAGCAKKTNEGKTDNGAASKSVSTTVSSTASKTDSKKTEEPKEKVKLTLAAAASLKNAFEKDLIPTYEKQHPNIDIEATYDSSGKLQSQIEQGLGADVFFSAATKQMKALVEGQYIIEADVIKLLENKVVLIQPKDAEPKLKDFNDLSTVDMLAIGDPASVPAGQYAEKVLTKLGLWEGLQGKLSLGSNVTEVLKWVEAGSAKAGIVYATDAASAANVAVVAEAPKDSLDKPVLYPVAPLAKSAHKTEAGDFVKFLQTEEALKVFEKYGFSRAK